LADLEASATDSANILRHMAPSDDN
jgi:hypothetical protein